jgi:CubicO group peptidase (beta-lactamase class C family)
MNRRAIGVVVVMFCVSPRASADQVDDYLTAQRAKNHIPAVSVAVVREGKLVKLQGYGVANLEWDTPASPETTYQLASATKPLTGTALMMLVEQGKLSLEESVTKYLPDAPDAWRTITVRHLATHTSGLPDDLGPAQPDTADGVIAAAAKRPLAYEPGSRSAYGFTDYVVLSRVMEKATGQPFAEIMRGLLFQPLGMTATAFNNEEEHGPVRTSDPLPRRASIYRWDGRGQKVFRFLYGKAGYAAGGLYSSSADLARFAAALDDGKLLKPTSLAAMWTAPALAGGQVGEFGVGWVVKRYRGRRVVGHSGGPALADLLRFPDEKLTVVVLCNQQRLYPYLAEGVADYFVPPPADPAKPIADTDSRLTAALRSVLGDAAAGRVNAELFTPEARKQFVPALREMGPQVLGVFDPVRSMELLEETKQGAATVRRYRVTLGSKPMIWTFVLDAGGKIQSMQPSSE